MSRSYKRTPGWTDGSRGHHHCSISGTKYAKRLANRKVRKSTISSNGGWYKKLFESWNIQDWKCLDDEKRFRSFDHYRSYLKQYSKYPFYEWVDWDDKDAISRAARMWFK